MRSGSSTIEINASCEAVFDLIHDYPIRLQWDPFLRAAYLLNGATQAEVGVSSRCVARWAAGGLGMTTVYISLRRPTLAAVSMTSGPFFLRWFAASIRHRPLGEGRSRVTYRYRFASKPRWLAWMIEPIVGRVFQHETNRRLRALKSYLEQELDHRTHVPEVSRA